MTDDDKDLIADLLVRWEEAFDQGQDVPAEQLCTDCPHLTQTVRSKIEILKTTAWTKKDPARPLTDQAEQPIKDISGTVPSQESCCRRWTRMLSHGRCGG